MLNFLGEKFDVSLIVSKENVNYSNHYSKNFKVIGVDFIKFNKIFMEGSPLSFSFLKKIDILKKFDIINVQEAYSPLSYQIINYCKKNNKKTILEIHENLKNHPGYKVLPYRFFSKENFKNSDIIINFTKMAMDALRQNFGSREKCYVLYPPVGDIFFYNENKNFDKIKFLFVGKLEKHKGIDKLLKCFDILSKEFVDCELNICGLGEYQNIVRNYCKKNKKISYFGYVRDEAKLSNIYKESNIFIQLPEPLKKFFIKICEEQVGYVYLEAMASGNVIITRDIGSVKEIVGEHNFLVNNSSLENVLYTMKYAIENKDNLIKISKKNVNRAKKVFNIKKWRKNFVSIIEDSYEEN
jgi:glycosyltransferase involved in cell wall biosynthesis